MLTFRELQYAQQDHQQESQTVPANPYNFQQNEASGMQYGRHGHTPQGMAPSPGKRSSIEGENPEMNAKLAASESLAAHKSLPLPTTTAMNTNYAPSAIISPQPVKPKLPLR